MEKNYKEIYENLKALIDSYKNEYDELYERNKSSNDDFMRGYGLGAFSALVLLDSNVCRLELTGAES